MTNFIEVVCLFKNKALMEAQLRSLGIFTDESGLRHPVHKYGHAVNGPIELDNGDFVMLIQITPKEADRMPTAENAALRLLWRSDSQEPAPVFDFVQYSNGSPYQIPDEVEEDGTVLSTKDYVKKMKVGGFGNH